MIQLYHIALYYAAPGAVLGRAHPGQLAAPHDQLDDVGLQGHNYYYCTIIVIITIICYCK